MMKTSQALSGALAGIAGGMVFGMMMAMMGMLPMVAQLVGSDSAVVGLIVHLVNSALIGAAFGLVLGFKVNSLSQGTMWGGIYGMTWWLLGALIIMPLWLGMPIQMHLQGIKNALPSLMGHMIYGITTGFAFHLIGRRAKRPSISPSLSRS